MLTDDNKKQAQGGPSNDGDKWQENRSKLYNTLSNDPDVDWGLKSEDEFDKWLDDDSNVQRLWGELRKENYDVGSLNDFTEKVRKPKQPMFGGWNGSAPQSEKKTASSAKTHQEPQISSAGMGETPPSPGVPSASSTEEQTGEDSSLDFGGGFMATFGNQQGASMDASAWNWHNKYGKQAEKVLMDNYNSQLKRIQKGRGGMSVSGGGVNYTDTDSTSAVSRLKAAYQKGIENGLDADAIMAEDENVVRSEEDNSLNISGRMDASLHANLPAEMAGAIDKATKDVVGATLDKWEDRKQLLRKTSMTGEDIIGSELGMNFYEKIDLDVENVTKAVFDKLFADPQFVGYYADLVETEIRDAAPGQGAAGANRYGLSNEEAGAISKSLNDMAESKVNDLIGRQVYQYLSDDQKRQVDELGGFGRFMVSAINSSFWGKVGSINPFLSERQKAMDMDTDAYLEESLGSVGSTMSHVAGLASDFYLFAGTGKAAEMGVGGLMRLGSGRQAAKLMTSGLTAKEALSVTAKYNAAHIGGAITRSALQSGVNLGLFETANQAVSAAGGNGFDIGSIAHSMAAGAASGIGGVLYNKYFGDAFKFKAGDNFGAKAAKGVGNFVANAAVEGGAFAVPDFVLKAVGDGDGRSYYDIFWDSMSFMMGMHLTHPLRAFGGTKGRQRYNRNGEHFSRNTSDELREAGYGENGDLLQYLLGGEDAKIETFDKRNYPENLRKMLDDGNVSVGAKNEVMAYLYDVDPRYFMNARPVRVEQEQTADGRVRLSSYDGDGTLVSVEYADDSKSGRETVKKAEERAVLGERSYRESRYDQLYQGRAMSESVREYAQDHGLDEASLTELNKAFAKTWDEMSKEEKAYVRDIQNRMDAKLSDMDTVSNIVGRLCRKYGVDQKKMSGKLPDEMNEQERRVWDESDAEINHELSRRKAEDTAYTLMSTAERSVGERVADIAREQEIADNTEKVVTDMLNNVRDMGYEITSYDDAYRELQMLDQLGETRELSEKERADRQALRELLDQWKTANTNFRRLSEMKNGMPLYEESRSAYEEAGARLAEMLGVDELPKTSEELSRLCNDAGEVAVRLYNEYAKAAGAYSGLSSHLEESWNSAIEEGRKSGEEAELSGQALVDSYSRFNEAWQRASEMIGEERLQNILSNGEVYDSFCKLTVDERKALLDVIRAQSEYDAMGDGRVAKAEQVAVDRFKSSAGDEFYSETEGGERMVNTAYVDDRLVTWVEGEEGSDLVRVVDPLTGEEMVVKADRLKEPGSMTEDEIDAHIRKFGASDVLESVERAKLEAEQIAATMMEGQADETEKVEGRGEKEEKAGVGQEEKQSESEEEKPSADEAVGGSVDKQPAPESLPDEGSSVQPMPMVSVPGGRSGIPSGSDGVSSRESKPVEETPRDELLASYEREQDSVAERGGLVKNEVAEAVLSEDWRGALHGLGRRIGRRFVVVSGEDAAARYGSGVQGWYEPSERTVYLNADVIRDDQSLRAFLTGHEITHVLKRENAELWNPFLDAVKESMGDDFAREFGAKRRRYDEYYAKLREQGRELTPLTDDEIAEEVACDWAGRHVLTDADAIRRIVDNAEKAGNDPRTIISRVLDWIKDKINAIRRGTGIGSKDDLAALEKAQKLWQDMYDVATARQNEKVIGKEDSQPLDDTQNTTILTEKEFAPTIPSGQEEAKGFIQRVIEKAKNFSGGVFRRIISGITKRQANDYAHIGISIDSDYVHSVENTAILHNQKKHGNPATEAKRGQIAIIEEDYLLIPDILENYDNIEKSSNKNKQGHDVIRYIKEYPDGTIYYLEEVRNGRKSLSFETMYKKKKGIDSSGGLMQEASTVTSETVPDNLNSFGKDTDSSANTQGKWRKRYEDELREAKEEFQRENPGETMTEEDAIYEVDSNDESSFYAEVEKAVGYERVDDIARELMAKQIEAVKKELTVENVLSAHQGQYDHGDPVYDLRYFGFWLHESGNKKGKYDLTVNTKWHDGIRYNPYYSQTYKGISQERAEILMKEAAERAMNVGSVVVPLSRLVEELDGREKIGENDADARLSVRNTGYTTRDDGTSLSNRAKDAEDEGSFTAGKFKSRYKVSGDAFDALEKLGVVEKSEWHHTGKRFNESDFFSWKDSDHIGGDTDYGAGEQAGLHARYMENKKEIDRLAADFKKRSWEYEDDEPVREMSYDQFCGERYRRLPVLSREEYLTEEQKREKERLHAEISGNERGLSSYGRYLEHRDIDERYDGLAFENYKKAEEETLRPEYDELERENAARLERNRTLDERNARTEGKEAAAMRMLELMGYGHDDALREVKSASKIGKRQEAMEHREQRRKEAEAEYEKKAAVIDGKREKWLADYMKKGKVREVTRVPLGEAPENFVETKREMNGRYGWFESSARYNLPEYVSGYAFDSKRLADSYRKFDGRKADAYRELVSWADLDFDPVETARRNSEMRRSEQEGADARFSISDDLTAKYGDRWLTEQTNDDGRHTTQVKNTINSYKKFGDWVREDSKGEPVSILDASSGLGLGTEWMRENGMMVDDVEPYPSENRIAPTYKSYADIDKKYDYIISNAVLNVIPDDWRAGLLHDMADKLNVGGKLVINVRGAESIRKQGIEGKTRITLDDPSEILVLRPDGSIKAYQKGFTKAELKAWCEDELGGGYSVEIANKKNAGGSYDTAVVVTKNNESTTNGSASELGQPIREDAAVANFGAKIANNSERTKRLDKLSLEIDKNGSLGNHQLLHEINVALNTEMSEEDGRRQSTDRSMYYDLGGGVSLRVSDHQGNADTFARAGHPNDNYGIVIKLSRSRFKDRDGVDYLEYVYYGDRIGDAERQSEIVEGLRDFLSTGDFGALPHPDRINPSGKFKKKGNGNEDARLSVREAESEDREERTLMGVHNISERKLADAIKLGGLANPSLAVIDTKNGMHTDYGKISLIPRSDLIDSRRGRNAGTWAGDAWTPTYPQIEKIMSDKGRDAYYEDVRGVSDNRELTGRLKMVWDNYLEGRDPDDLAYWFFKDQGVEPEKVFFDSGFSEEQRKRYAELTDNGRKGFGEMSDDERSGIISMMAEQEGITAEEKLAKYRNLRERNAELLAKDDLRPFKKVMLQRTIDEIDKYGLTLSPVNNFLYGMKQALKNDGKLDVDGTLKKSRDKMQADGMEEDFRHWLEEKERRYGVKEMLFDGYTRDGDRKYVPNTVENASRMMNREPEANSGGQTGFGASRAMLLEKMHTLADIRKQKGKLKGVDEDSEQLYKAASDEMFEVVNALSDMQKISDNPFSNVEYANARLNEALGKKDPIGYLNKEFGYKISKDGEFSKRLKSMVETLGNLPVKYFETKFRRPVRLNEFAVAVVPEKTSAEVVKALKDAGLDVRTYDGTEEGRQKVTMDAVRDRDDVRFSLGDRLSDPMGSVRGAVERVGKAEDRERDVKEQFDRTRQRGIDTADRILDDATATDKQRHQRMTDVIREVTRIDGLRKAGKETVRERVRSIADTLTEMIPATDEFTRGEVKRLIGKIDKAMDVKDVKRNVREAVNIVLKSAERDVDAETMSLRKTKGKRLDADSQLKQGQLDLKGQHVLDEFNRVADDVAVDLDQLEQQYAGEMGNMDLSEVHRANAADKLDGVKLAQLYRKSVKEKDQNISELNEMKRAEEEKIYNFRKRLVFDADGNVVKNKRTGEVRTETVKILKPEFRNQGISDENKAIKQSVLDTIDAIEDNITELRGKKVGTARDFNEELGGMIREGRQRAKSWIEEQKQRRQEIWHNANSDMEGIDSRINLNEDKTVRRRVANTTSGMFASFRTFDTYMRRFGRKAPNGEGYLYERFVRNGVDKSSAAEWEEKKRDNEELDAKVHELFGKRDGAYVLHYPDMERICERIDDEYRHSHDGKLIEISFLDKGKPSVRELTSGQALYVWLTNRQTDGRMKLRAMGITDETVDYIERELDPRILEFGRWMTDDLLVRKRDKYNEVYRRINGADMDFVENYFPIAINKLDVDEKKDITAPNAEKKTSTSASATMKRTRNAKAIDLSTDAFMKLSEHLDEMNHYYAYGEISRDLNDLINYKHFEAQVKNMGPSTLGSGDKVWNNFIKSVQIATGNYKPETDIGSKFWNGVAKNVTGAKIAFRPYTALKQFTSYPAFFSDANARYLAKYWFTPASTIKWAMDNLPLMEKRWKERKMGDIRLYENESDYNYMRGRLYQGVQRRGMWLNAGVDLWTCAAGARAVYETRKKYYTDRLELDEQTAHERALGDANAAFNQSQQSAEGAYLSPLQVNQGIGSKAITLFRNGPMGYGRQLHNAISELAHGVRANDLQERIAYREKQLMRMGVAEDVAKREAAKDYKRAARRNWRRLVIFGNSLSLLWNVAMNGSYYLAGDDSEEKKRLFWEDLKHSAAGVVEGLPMGDFMSDAFNVFVNGGKWEYLNLFDMPFISDFQDLFKKADEKDEKSVPFYVQLANTLTQTWVGVNPKTVTDLVCSVWDLCDDDEKKADSYAFSLMTALQFPQSGLEQAIIDNCVDENGNPDMEAYDRISKQYIESKMRKDGQFLYLLASDEEKEKARERYQKRFDTKMKDRATDYFSGLLDEQKLRKNAKKGSYGEKGGGKNQFGEFANRAPIETLRREKEFYDLEQSVKQKVSERPKKTEDPDGWEEWNDENPDVREMELDIKETKKNLRELKKLIEDDPDNSDVYIHNIEEELDDILN